MSRPRALVIRSGTHAFLPSAGSAMLDAVEIASHSIERLDPPASALAGPVHLAIFTSQIAVERVAEDARLTSLFTRAIAGGKIAAVGAATADALRSHGIEPALVGEGSAEALVRRLPDRLDGWRVMLPCAEDGGDALPEALQLKGARVERAVVYRKVPRLRDASLEREIVDRPFAVFCATSPSAARWLFEGMGEASLALLRKTPAVALGPSTRRSLHELGVARVAVSDGALFSSALSLLERLATEAGAA